MVYRNLTIPHEFRVFTEAECHEKGWWNKIELTKPGLFDGWVMYLDLDIVIRSNIDHLVKLALTDVYRVWMRDDFSYPLSKNHRKDLDPETRKLLGGPGCCNSSVMIWHGNAMFPVWEAWSSRRSEILSTLHGDQNLISQVLWPDKIGFLPETSVQSYKYGKLRGESPSPITVCHGNPKPHEIREPWVREHWC